MKRASLSYSWYGFFRDQGSDGGGWECTGIDKQPELFVTGYFPMKM
jgi:hypothetical protein